MAYSIEVKEKAIKLRKKGYSIKEIAELLGIAQSTSSIWLSDITLSKKAQERLAKRRILGQYKALLISRRKREKLETQLNKKAKKTLSKINFDRNLYRLLCALLFWAEGNKDYSRVGFISSDPLMIASFLFLLRKAFVIDEKKLRALVHVHEYHNEKELKNFWSKITKIPLSRFTKSFKKPNTKKRIKEGYMGSLRIAYYDSRVARELASVYNIFAKDLT